MLSYRGTSTSYYLHILNVGLLLIPTSDCLCNVVNRFSVLNCYASKYFLVLAAENYISYNESKCQLDIHYAPFVLSGSLCRR